MQTNSPKCPEKVAHALEIYSNQMQLNCSNIQLFKKKCLHFLPLTQFYLSSLSKLYSPGLRVLLWTSENKRHVSNSQRLGREAEARSF